MIVMKSIADLFLSWTAEEQSSSQRTANRAPQKLKHVSPLTAMPCASVAVVVQAQVWQPGGFWP